MWCFDRTPSLLEESLSEHLHITQPIMVRGTARVSIIDKVIELPFHL